MIFSEQDRRIYQCPVTKRFHDPMAVKRSITVESRGKFNDLVADARGTDEVKRAVAEGRLVEVGRKALSLPPIDGKTGEGVPDEDAYAALIAFTVWLKGKGERALTTRHSAPCTDCPPPSPTTPTSR